MNARNRVRLFQRAVARYGLFASAWLFDRLPLWAVNMIAKVFLITGYTFTMRQRRIARKSLEIAFSGEKTDAQITDIIRKCFFNFGRGMVEMIYCLSHPEMIEKKVTFQGLEKVDKALKEGRGIIAVTAHFGNFPLMMLAFANRQYKVSCVIRPTRDNEVEEYLSRKRSQVGLKTVYAKPTRTTVTESLKVLRNNEILFIPIDQNFGSNGGVYVDFFGRKAATATGPVVFAHRTKAPIVPMFIIHKNDHEHLVIVEDPITLEEGKDEQDTLLINTSRITQLIEQYIRRYPHEWAWMHRRWKSRPYFIEYVPNA